MWFVITIVFGIAAFALAAWVARMPERKSIGVLLGTMAGVLFAFVSYAAVGFMSYIVPSGQVDFWLSSLVSKILGVS